MEAYTVERELESTEIPSTVDISIDDLTSNTQINDDGNLIGDGSFDKLMETVEKHISKQVDDGRITTEAYAEVYLNSLIKVLDVANMFVLESKVKNYQIQEIAENTKLTGSKKLLTDKQSELETANIVLTNSKSMLTVRQLGRESASINLLEAQVEELRNYKSKEYKARTNLIVKQTEVETEKVNEVKNRSELLLSQVGESNSKIKLITAQTDTELVSKDTEESRKALICAQTGNELAKRDNVKAHTDLLKAQRSVESRKAVLVTSQINTEDQKTELTKMEVNKTLSDTALVDKNITLTEKQKEELDSKISKYTAETNSLLNERKQLTEAQVIKINKDSEEVTRRIKSMQYQDALTNAQTVKVNKDNDEITRRIKSMDYQDALTEAQITRTQTEEVLTKVKVNEVGARIDHTKAEIDSIVNYKNNNIHSNTLHNYAKIRSADHQNTLLTKQAEVTEKQQNLIERQTKGFDDDAKLRLLKEVLGNWSVAYSVAQDDVIPDSIKSNPIDSVTKNLFDSLGVENQDDPLGED